MISIKSHHEGGKSFHPQHSSETENRNQVTKYFNMCNDTLESTKESISCLYFTIKTNEADRASVKRFDS